MKWYRVVDNRSSHGFEIGDIVTQLRSDVFKNPKGDTWHLNSNDIVEINDITKMLVGKKGVQVISPYELNPIKAVYFNEIKRTTTVRFNDGDIITVKCSPDTEFDKHTGFVNAIAQKYIGSNSKIKRYINNATEIKKRYDVGDKVMIKSTGEKLTIDHVNRKGYMFAGHNSGVWKHEQLELLKRGNE